MSDSGVGSLDLALESAAVFEAHGDLVGVFDDVIVGQDVAVRGNDDAGSLAFQPAGPVAMGAAVVLKAAAQFRRKNVP